MKDAIAILCGGGPAPGINTVISSVAKVFLNNGYRVIGLHEGYKGLFSTETRIDEIDYEFADDIYTRGGSALRMSRFKPDLTKLNVSFFKENNIKLLVTIGGDDTASTANRISKYLEENNVTVQNIHVPKTIDNDLPLPEGIPTFGYNSAKNEGVLIANTVLEDARTSQNWFILSAMGREAGHLTIGIGSACHYPMIIIPEMFENVPVTFENIIRLNISSILKRKLLGLKYGASIISEGVFHFMSEDEINNSGIDFPQDDHGHPELHAISKSHVFANLVQKRVKELNLPNKMRPVELGFEVRCAKPIGYDLTYCTLLGFGVYQLFSNGDSRCMVSVDHNGDVKPLFLKDVEDENGRVKARLVNLHAANTQAVLDHGMHYITEKDYEAAKAFVDNPEYYDFNKILKR
ncbi:6-phosphofructokinase [Persicobacter psychrovividus]|uniref:Pyrophosphate--fructose 6-phosphate 1-phosphotransferase n=1 Tax=Persicobacter psychrovividus TaxID=387638 RepID=A0ABM7VE68_9BACT|nr:pyrophosphate--fructose 6-phosphate 1-phosphotransferase [Persicobacter psychrovividus]